MRISVKVKPGSREDAVEQVGQNEFAVRVKAPAVENKANAAAIKLLSEYLDISKSRFIIIRGKTGRNKVIEVVE